MERLAGIDASFLYLETPQVHMHVAFACILDPADRPGGYDFAAVLKHIEDRVARHPVFRRRLARVPFDLHHPLWVEDPNFDLIHHVRRVAVPAPGDAKEFGAMVGRINSTPLDRARPLWEMWLIEGLSGGRVGFMLKVHHSVMDGMSGTGLLLDLFDKSPTPAPLAPPEPPHPERLPSDFELVAFALRSRFMQPFRATRTVTATLMKVAGFLRMQLRNSNKRGGRPLEAPRTHFNRSVSPRRNLAVMRVPLNEVRRIKQELGCTVNDVILAIAGGGLRHYLLGRRSLPETSLTAGCPVSVRAESEASEFNNKVSIMWTTLATDTADPLERVGGIHETTVGAKREFDAMGADTLLRWAEFAGPRMFNLAVRTYSHQHLADHHRPVHNLIISNVPGPQHTLYMAGMKLEAAYPAGPVMEGAGINLTVFSYDGFVDFGYHVDSELVPDVWDLADATKRAFEELCEAVASRTRDHASRDEPQTRSRAG
jgi:diacylglycerol O-acyltransferase